MIGQSFGLKFFSEFSLSDFPNLEWIYIGSGSFPYLSSFTLSNNPKLKRFEIGDAVNIDNSVNGTFNNVDSFNLISKVID